MLNIFVDTREQKPLSFNEEYIDNVVKFKLDYGDYAGKVGEHRIPVIFERKSVPDLLGTLTGGYDRFAREVARAHEEGYRLVIIVEKPITDIIKGTKHSKVNGLAVLRTMFTLMIKHGVPFVCCKNREEMSKYIAEFFYSYAKDYLRKQKEVT